jgi:hypothetical protein
MSIFLLSLLNTFSLHGTLLHDQDSFLGNTGFGGALGRPGSPGNKGDPGQSGHPGPRGERGVPGNKGDRGDPGMRGAKGDRVSFKFSFSTSIASFAILTKITFN